MGGYFGSVARSLGQTGSDVFDAKELLRQIQQQIATQKLDDLQKQLGIKQQQGNLEELPLRIQQMKQQAAMLTPEGKRAYLKSLLGRDPTENEILQFEGLAPKFTQGKGQPIPGPQIGRPEGTYWLPTLDSQQNVVSYTQTGPPAAGGTSGAPKVIAAPGGQGVGVQRRLANGSIGTVLPGSPEWTPDDAALLKQYNQSYTGAQGEKDKRAKASRDFQASEKISPDERRRQIEYRTSLGIWNSKLQKLQADYKTAQGSWTRGGSVDDAKAKLDNMQKAVDFINSEQDDVYTGKAALADVLARAQEIADGNL